MATALSVDHCSRVIAAVNGGTCRRGAAARLASTIRQASAESGRRGRPAISHQSHRAAPKRESVIDRHGDLVMDWTDVKPDLILEVSVSFSRPLIGCRVNPTANPFPCNASVMSHGEV